ncbi:MAG: DUF1642 domain-containing protein [Streptococcaceae bacterium]|nr:DUF1642 domain-containing protein [Streptococcaceae bacterium]
MRKKLYYIEFPCMYIDHDDYEYTSVEFTKNSSKLRVGSYINSKGEKFTLEEIKAIDERYLAFVVEVSE